MTDPVIPDVRTSTGKAQQPDIRQAYQYTQDWLDNRPRVTYTSQWQRVVAQGPNVPLYDENAALGLMGNLKPHEGAIDELKRDLYWSGFYGDAPPVIGGDNFSREDLTALYKAMDQAELAGGVDVIDLVKGMSNAGRSGGVPLGVKGDLTDDPAYQFMDFAKKNGIKLSDEFIADRVAAIGAGTTTIDKELSRAREKYVATAFPAWADEIRSGLNVEDIAAPYKQAVANVLEIPESQIDLNDPTLRSGLQSVDAVGKPTYKPLWLFERELKKDPRWQYTDNAYKSVIEASQGALSEMGF